MPGKHSLRRQQWWRGGRLARTWVSPETSGGSPCVCAPLRLGGDPCRAPPHPREKEENKGFSLFGLLKLKAGVHFLFNPNEKLRVCSSSFITNRGCWEGTWFSKWWDRCL